MAEIVLARVDARMIHGAVVSTWVPNTHANVLFAVDDETYQNEFKCTIMKNCALNIRSEVYSVEKLVEVWNSGRLRNRKVLVVFKSIDMAYQAYRRGFPLSALQLGYIIPDETKTIQADDRKAVIVSLEDIEKLRELRDAGIDIYMQYSPQFVPVAYTKYET